MTIRGLSIGAFADRVGLSVNTIKYYRRKKMLPAPPDIEIIDAAGKVISEAWHPETIDAWNAERPGRGNRFYLKG
ncbi:transcriptional regulator [Mycobacteroides abscessus]|uniref:transcriptional regulator n=1 Tax=Mycobacteroides abscessus TaxID=36809 RepID=UPI000C258439|nr:transcriptional regulator [Mycobacteroides abscessus]